MNIVEIGSIKRELPSKWDELTKKQLIFVSNLFSRKLPVTEFKIRALANFLNIKKRLLTKINNEDAYFLAETTNFLITHVDLTQNKIPRVRTGRKWYYGPDDGMGYCTFGEFIKVQLSYEAYIKSKDDHCLNEIAAILYRQKKFVWFIRKHFTSSSDPRIKLMDRTLPVCTKQMARVNKDVKYSIFLFVSGVLGSLPARFPNIYRQKNGIGDENLGWASLVIGLANGNTDDESIDRVMNSNMYNVFMGMEQKAIDYFRLEQQIEKEKKR
jgi:hypothetical protein